MMYRCLVILMLAAVGGFAQPRKAAAGAVTRWPIENLLVEGTRIYTPAQVLAVAALKVGQVAGKPEFDAARDRLVATGAFETVGYKFAPAGGGKGYTATFQVTEIEQSYPVIFEDLHASALELNEVLKAKDPLFASGRLPATQPVLEKYNRWIEAFLVAQGADAKLKVTGNVTALSPNEFAIVFRPVGDPPVVALVTFRGNTVIAQDVLHEAISGSAIGTPYTEDRFRDVLYSSIRPLYEARGRVRVTFPEVRTEPTTDVKGLHVFVTVNEGESFNLGSLVVEDPTPVSGASLLKEANLKTGDVADFDKVNASLEVMRKAVRHAGYLNAKVVFERKLDLGKNAVDLTFHIDAGPQFSMGKLDMKGLDLEGEAEIKRIWTLTEGKPFNPDYPDFFLNRIKEGGLFDHLGATKADIKPDEKRHVADVMLTFGGDAGKQAPSRRGGRGGRGGQ